MSYLGFPRIHFAGTFFTNPGNLNNATPNYANAAEGKPLTYDTGRYNNPKGVAQYYLRACQVTQIIGGDGQPLPNDPLLGASVETVSPWGAQTSPSGESYTLAKIADLDPDMQFRSELYGFRLFVRAAGGQGFSGALAVPQLRDLFFNRGDAGVAGLQVACGTWHQRLRVERAENPSASAVLGLLGVAIGSELDVKLSVDMFQTSPSEQFTTGNMYCYGRLMGTIGAVSSGMPMQVVPGRRLYASAAFQSAAAASRAPAKAAVLTRQAAERLGAPSAPAAPLWNNTDARVVTSGAQSHLLVDMGTATPLKTPSNGVLNVGAQLAFGYLREGDFVPFESQGTTFAGKAVSAQSQLTDYVALPEAAAFRDSAYLRNAGVVQVALTSAEVKALSTSPLCIQSDGVTVLKENPSGYYVNGEAASCRLQPEQALSPPTLSLVAFRFGEPVPALSPGTSTSGTAGLALALTPQVVVYDKSGTGAPAATDIFSAQVATEPVSGAPGQFALSVKTGPAQSLAANEYRRPMDSLLCFLNVSSNQGLVGENPGTGPYLPMLSLLFWQNQWIVAQPSWNQNIQPILNIYARLYPGMVSLLDIADEATVKANANAIRARLNLAASDPGFMPVVRDMSPATIAMLSSWLAEQVAASAGAAR